MIVTSGKAFLTSYSPIHFVLKFYEGLFGSAPAWDTYINRFTPGVLATHFAMFHGTKIFDSSKSDSLSKNAYAPIVQITTFESFIVNCTSQGQVKSLSLIEHLYP